MPHLRAGPDRPAGAIVAVGEVQVQIQVQVQVQEATVREIRRVALSFARRSAAVGYICRTMAAMRPDSHTGIQEVLRLHGWPVPRLAGVRGELPPWELDTALRMALDARRAGGRRGPRGVAGGALRRGAAAPVPAALPGVGRSAWHGWRGTSSRSRRGCIGEQVARGGDGIAERLPFVPLAEPEIAAWPSADEYRRLLARTWTTTALLACYAMAQQWLGFSSADHILGVTGVALWMGRQLARFVPVDLPLLHGAAIGHDVGKFGCVGEEERRIPRLHYYYTHAWYQAPPPARPRPHRHQPLHAGTSSRCGCRSRR